MQYPLYLNGNICCLHLKILRSVQNFLLLLLGWGEVMLPCGRNLIPLSICIYDVVSFPVPLVFWGTSRSRTLKCEERFLSWVVFWMLGSTRQMNEVESGLTAWENSECKCTVKRKKKLYGILLLFRNRSQFQSLYLAGTGRNTTTVFAARPEDQMKS